MIGIESKISRPSQTTNPALWAGFFWSGFALCQQLFALRFHAPNLLVMLLAYKSGLFVHDFSVVLLLFATMILGLQIQPAASLLFWHASGYTFSWELPPSAVFPEAVLSSKSSSSTIAKIMVLLCYFASTRRFPASSQLMTFQKAAIYSARRFWYFR